MPPASWTLHGLRRTTRTGLARIKVAPHVAERIIGHRPSKIEQVYNLHDYRDEVALALERWAAHVELLAAGRKVVADNVVRLHGAAQ